jgi:hypothetical protein
MLPEERTLMTLQREIEEEFGMKLGSDGSGKSVSASLLKCLATDFKYAFALGHLQNSVGDSNQLVQSCKLQRRSAEVASKNGRMHAQ